MLNIFRILNKSLLNGSLTFLIMDKKHFAKKWEISFIELINGVETKYKVTRKIPELSISETILFKSKEKAKKKFEEWLR